MRTQRQLELELETESHCKQTLPSLGMKILLCMLWTENGSHREVDRLCFERSMPSCAVLLGVGHRNLRS